MRADGAVSYYGTWSIRQAELGHMDVRQEEG